MLSVKYKYFMLVGPRRPTSSTTQFALKTPPKFENFEKFTKLDRVLGLLLSAFLSFQGPTCIKQDLNQGVAWWVGGVAFDSNTQLEV